MLIKNKEDQGGDLPAILVMYYLFRSDLLLTAKCLLQTDCAFMSLSSSSFSNEQQVPIIKFYVESPPLLSSYYNEPHGVLGFWGFGFKV